MDRDTARQIRAFNRFYSRVLGVFDQRAYLGSEYSMTEARLIGEIGRRQGITANELGALLRLDKGYASRLLAKLSDEGLLEKSEDARDRRNKRLALTERGMDQWEALDEMADRELREQMKGLSPEAIQKIADAMSAIQTEWESGMGKKKAKAMADVALRPARPADAKLAARFIEEARQFQREQGFVQWTAEYPKLSDVEEDIRRGTGYMLTEADIPFGYLCCDFSGEPAYERIDGAWKTGLPYAVVHRMAFGRFGQGRGAAGSAFRCVKALCAEKGVDAIRVDTDGSNERMRHVLEREGFRYCGVIEFQSGPKRAYEWDRVSP